MQQKKKTPSQLVQEIRSALARFRRQRPLRAGSLLVTILGDSVAPRGGMIALASLIELARPFGLAERLVRTSVGRLAHEGWVHSVRSGRASFYELTPHGRARFAEATERIYGGSPPSWNGRWTLIVIAAAPGAIRESVRRELSWLGFGQLTPGVFAHPTHEEHAIRARVAELEAAGRVILVRNAEVSAPAAARLARIGWDFDDLARRYRRFISMFEPVDAAFRSAPESAIDDEAAFVLRTLLLHEYRKIHLRDPLLPAELLSPDWVGFDAQALCTRLYANVFVASERHLDAAAQTIDGPLPAPSKEIFRRFGGLPRR